MSAAERATSDRRPGRRRIAVVGAGIAGLGAAWLLGRDHEVVVYEAAGRLGGHANTLEIEHGGRTVAVDTGFIVYNDRNYPNLVRLFETLGVETAASDMSFSFSAGGGAFEYAGSLGGLFAQRANLLRPCSWRLLRDILRFYREAPAVAEDPAAGDRTVGDWLDAEGYGRVFVEEHLMPMAAAIWSSPLAEVRRFPLSSFLGFFRNHGLLQAADRPRWRTVAGGSRRYVERLAARFDGQIRLATPAVALERRPEGVFLRDAGGGRERFDEVVLACHGDQARAILGAAASPAEQRLLGPLRYQPNRAILHGDAGLMPRRRAVWSSWNYLSQSRPDGTDPQGERSASVTYWMNRLQPLGDSPPLFVSLNPLREPAPGTVLAELAYDHPLLDVDTLRAQRLLPEVQGRDRLWFCGAWTGYGFHEDGLASGFAVAAALGSPAPWAETIDGPARPTRRGPTALGSPAGANATPVPVPQAAE